MGSRKGIDRKSEPFTEYSIQRRLDNFFSTYKYNVDGLYVFEWESDKLLWTKSGYIYEFEIKVSRSDFKNDFKKKDKHIILEHKEKYMPTFYSTYERNKSIYPTIEAFAERHKNDTFYLVENHRRPNYFYYAVPEGLIEPDEVPEYAGLVYVLNEYASYDTGFRVVKKAPVLHYDKYTDTELKLSEKFYYNWQNDKGLRVKYQQDAEDARKTLNEELETRGQEVTYKQMEANMKAVCDECNYYKDAFAKSMRNRNIDRMIINRMRNEILKLNPDFDYNALEIECEKAFGIG